MELLSLLVAISLSYQLPCLAKDVDHLIPPTSIFAEDSNNYPLIVSEVLLRKSTGTVQLVVLPSFEKEHALFIQFNESTKPVVHLVRPTENIYSALKRIVGPKITAEKMKTDINSTDFRSFVELSKDFSVSVEEKSAAISNEAAEELSKVWAEALFRTAYERSTDVRFDGVTYHFSHWPKQSAPLAGSTNSPPQKTKMSDLVNLGDLLAKFVEADPTKQKEIEQKLIADSRKLLKRLKQK
jgi:hypothetical protein